LTESRGVSVVGAGGHAKVVISTLRDAGFTIATVLDDDESRIGSEILGFRVEGTTQHLLEQDGSDAVLAIGDNSRRRQLAGRFSSVRWITVVHPTATVDPSVKIGHGTVVFAGAVIQAETTLGAHVIVNTGAMIDHDCLIGDFAHLGPGSHLAGTVEVREGAMLGIGGVVVPGTRIGSWTTVGAGAAVTRDLPAGVTAVGIPARPLRSGRRAGERGRGSTS